MTITVSASEIQIKNSLGNVKFTSNDKLVYQKYYQTGTVYLNSGNNSTVSVSFPSLDTKDFLVISIIITSSTGVTEVTQGLLNKEIPANGSIIVDFRTGTVNNLVQAKTEWLGVDYVGGFLRFQTTEAFGYRISPGVGSYTVTYKARIWSYL